MSTPNKWSYIFCRREPDGTVFLDVWGQCSSHVAAWSYATDEYASPGHDGAGYIAFLVPYDAREKVDDWLAGIERVLNVRVV